MRLISQIRKGANLQALDGSGRSAVEIAIARMNADCVTILRLAQLMDEEVRGGHEGGQFSSQDTFLLALQVCCDDSWLSFSLKFFLFRRLSPPRRMRWWICLAECRNDEMKDVEGICVCVCACVRNEEYSMSVKEKISR